jgi:hypothetical protein
MPDDLDIYRAARLLIDQHGDEAAIRAAERADAHCAIIVGDREEPSGESRLKYKRGD